MKLNDFLYGSKNNLVYLKESAAMDLYEALKLMHDKANNLIAVVSDETDPKSARQETYRNKEALKRAGFRWSGGNWVIDADKFDVARNTISTLNKTEYLITKLEDTQEFIGDATTDPKKGLLTQKIQDYIDELANSTDEAAASEEIRRYLNFFSSFHQYSFHNRILIYIQNKDATHVASFNAWKKKGRVVKKGAKGLKILVPVFAGNKEGDGEDDENEKRTPVRFIVGNVFDIADTEATSEKGEIPETPNWWEENEPSETADALYKLVVKAAASEGIDVTDGDSRHGEKGFSKGGHINITSDVQGASRVSTMVHEYAHELMHWADQSKFYVGKEVVGNRALAELQAESVSYVVMKHYGIPCEHHTTYLALWKANKDRVKQNVESISKVAYYIINKIDQIAEKESK